MQGEREGATVFKGLRWKCINNVFIIIIFLL